MNDINTYTTLRDLFLDFGTQGTIEWLKTNLSIEARPYEDGKLFMLNYNQIDSPKTHPIVMQCRSLIVNEFFETVSAKFTRFFNIGEAPEITGRIDIGSSTIFDKEDGSLIGIWFNPVLKRYDISSRSMAYCEGDFEMPDGSKKSWREMILETLAVSEEEFQYRMRDVSACVGMEETDTLIFEWCHPLNRIVTPYEKPKMFLTAFSWVSILGGHIIKYEDEAYLKEVVEKLQTEFQNIEMIGHFNSEGASIAAIEDKVASLPNLQEGFVIRCNKTGIRAKIKSKTYVTAHRIRGEFKIPRDKDLCALVFANEQDEFLSYFPEWKNRVNVIESTLNDAYAKIEQWYTDNDWIESQKDYALTVQKDFKSLGIISGLLFKMRKSHKPISFSSLARDLSENKFYDLYLECASICKRQVDMVEMV